jgi:TP901 family phage tail tape measure protein
MTTNTDFGRVADDLRKAATAFAVLTSASSAFGGTLNEFRQFERQLTLTNAIAGGTVNQFNAMTEAAKEFSLVTTVSATEAGVALQQLAQAGFSAVDSLSAMAGVLLLAQATLTDVSQASDIISSNIRAFKLETAETTRVSNVFTAAVTGSLATVDKLAFALRQVAPVAELANLSIEETTAFLGQLFNIGLRGEQAGTALRNIIIRLVRPLGEANTILENNAIATRTATGELRNLADILTDIGNANIDNADLARVFETEALAGAVALIDSVKEASDSGASSYSEFLQSITGTNRAIEVAAENLQTFDGALLLFRNTIADVQKDIGAAFAPIIVDVTDSIKDLIIDFKALDAETQQLIIYIAGAVSGLVGFLAITNALLLLMPTFVKTGLTATALGFANVTKNAITSGTALRGFLAAIATSRTAITSFITLLSGIPAVLRGVALAAAITFATPAAIIGGVAAATAAVAGLTLAFFGAKRAISSLNNARLDKLKSQLDFSEASAEADNIIDSLLGEDAIEEFVRRRSILDDQLKIARQTLTNPFDLAQFANRAQINTTEQGSIIKDQIAALEEEFSDVIEYQQEIRRIDGVYEQTLKEIERLPERVRPTAIAGARRRRDQTLEAFNETVDARFLARKTQFDATVAKLTEESSIVSDNVDTLFSLEKEAINSFLSSIATNTTELEGQFALLTPVLRNLLNDNTGLAGSVAAALADGDDTVRAEDVLREAFEQSGDGAALNALQRAIEFRQEQGRAALDAALESFKASNDTINDEASGELLELELSRASTLGATLKAATELANKELVADLSSVGDDLAENYLTAFNEFGITQKEGIAASFNSLKETLDEIPNNTIFSDVVSGKAILDAIRSSVSADSSPDEIRTIIERQFSLYSELMTSFVNSLIEAGTITDEDAALIFSAFNSSSTAAANAALAGIGSAEDLISDATKRFATRSKRSSRSGRDALKDARQVEDAFLRAERSLIASRRTFLENAPVGDIDTRINLTVENDVARITNSAQAAVRQAQRRLEDIQRRGVVSGDQLAELRQKYSRVIEEINRARDAEIVATTSYASQMDIRREAIDLFIRDLQTSAIASGDVLSQVNAGVAVSFANYAKEVETVMGITEAAVTSYLDVVSAAAGDFIFDTENAFENFKNTMLSISQDIFAGFTRILLQNAIQSQLATSLFAGFGGGGGIQDILSSAIIGGFAGGGLIRGPGTGTSDDILARVSDKEYITNSRATQENLRLLEAINSNASKQQVADIALREAGISAATPAPSLATSSPIPQGANTTQSASTINLTVNYYLTQSGSDDDAFKRTSAQHAKQLQVQLQKANKLT